MDRREVGGEIGRHKLEQVLGVDQILQTVLSEVADRGGPRQQGHRLRRQQDLSAVGGRADPRRTMHIQTHVVVPAEHGFAAVQTHPHAHPPTVRPGLSRQDALRVGRAEHGRACGRERGEDRIAGGGHRDATMRGDGSPNDLVVALQDVRVPPVEVQQEPRRALDVGDEEGDNSSRQAPRVSDVRRLGPARSRKATHRNPPLPRGSRIECRAHTPISASTRRLAQVRVPAMDVVPNAGLASRPRGEVPAVSTRMVRAGDGRVLAVCQWGLPAGSPVFFLHGTPGSRYLRQPGGHYERLGLRVLTYDRPGYGDSTRAAGRTVADVAADVITIADTFGIDRFGVAGVSGGGAPAFAVAALAADRVTRCAGIVCGPPVTARGLDYFADLTVEDREFWRQVGERGEEYLLAQFAEMAAWVRAGMTDLDVPDDDRAMLLEALGEAFRPGPWGFVDDFLAASTEWGFDLDDVLAPTRVMLARGDPSVPPSHADWLAQHLRNGQVDWVDGDHFGPRDNEEMELMQWVGLAGEP